MKLRFALLTAAVGTLIAGIVVPNVAGAAAAPSQPYIATFYYPWFDNPAKPSAQSGWGHWGDAAGMPSHNPPANWSSHYLPDNPSFPQTDPNNQLYSAQDWNTVFWQLSNLAYAHIGVAIASWWGPNDQFGTDPVFGQIVDTFMNYPPCPPMSATPSSRCNPAPSLRWAVYYEKEAYTHPPISEIEADLDYLLGSYTKQPSYLRIGGRPVIFVYDPQPQSGDIQKWEQVQSDTGFRVDFSVNPHDFGVDPSALYGWHQYDPTVRFAALPGYFGKVSPGFWKDGQSGQVLVRDPSAFAGALRQLVSANTPWKFVETWNEYGEGTQVEPATEVTEGYGMTPSIVPESPPLADGAYGDAYLNAMHAILPAPTAHPAIAVGVEGVRATGFGQAPQLGQGWKLLGGPLAGAPAVAAIPQSAGVAQPLYVATGANHRLYVRTAYRSWHGLSSVPTYCLDGPGAAVIDGQLWVACEGRNRTLYIGTATASLSPVIRHWSSLGGRLSAGPAVAAVGGVPTFFVTGSNGALYTRTLTGAWAGFGISCLGHPAAGVAPSGATTYVACNSATQLVARTSSGGGWSKLITLGGLLRDGPAVAATDEGVFFVVEGANHHAYVRTLNTGWVGAGGYLVGGVSAVGLD